MVSRRGQKFGQDPKRIAPRCDEDPFTPVISRPYIHKGTYMTIKLDPQLSTCSRAQRQLPYAVMASFCLNDCASSLSQQELEGEGLEGGPQYLLPYQLTYRDTANLPVFQCPSTSSGASALSLSPSPAGTSWCREEPCATVSGLYCPGVAMSREQARFITLRYNKKDMSP